MVPPAARSFRVVTGTGFAVLGLLAAACGSGDSAASSVASDRPPDDLQVPPTSTSQPPASTSTSQPPAPTSTSQPPAESQVEPSPGDAAHRPVPDPVDAPDQLVVLGIDGVVRASSDGVLRPLGERADAFASQPTWAPGGTRVAWAEFDPTGASQIAIATPDGSDLERLDVPFNPFYFHWSPDGAKLAFLGGNPVTLGILDTATSTVDIVDVGTPYYFDWAPDSSTLVTHIGESGVTIGAPGDPGPQIAPSSRAFLAPEWTPNGSAVLYVLGPEPNGGGLIASAGRQPIAQPLEPPLQLVRYEVASDEVTTLVEFRGRISFDVSPDGRSLAFSITDGGEQLNFGPLVTMDFSTGEQTTISAAPVMAYEWAPDSSSLAFLTPTEDSTAVQWAVGSPLEVLLFDPFLPSDTYTRSYLPFFDQFARSMTRWAPDSSGIVYSVAGLSGDQIWWQPADGGSPGIIGDGSIGTFAAAATFAP